MQEFLNGYDEFLESLRKECRSQRNILGLSQEKVCRILEEEYGLIKDISKISQYESGKTRIPDFLPEYCEILKIKFPKVICEKTSQEQEENYMNIPVISNAIKRSQTNKLNIQACSRLRGGEKGWKVCKYVKNEYGLYEMKKNDTGQTNYEYIEALPLNGFIWYDLVVL